MLEKVGEEGLGRRFGGGDSGTGFTMRGRREGKVVETMGGTILGAGEGGEGEGENEGEGEGEKEGEGEAEDGKLDLGPGIGKLGAR